LDEYVQDHLRDEEFQTPITGVPGELDLKLVHTMYDTLKADRSLYFDQAYDYYMGDHLQPYAPRDASDQIIDLQERSITNWMPLLVHLPVQVSYVDGYRRGSYGLGSSQTKAPTTTDLKAGKDPKRFSAEYACWQRNRMDARQATLYKSALMYGHSFAHVNNVTVTDPKVEILSTRNTVAFFDDPVNDIRPKIVLTVKYYARDEKTPGLAVLWDDTHRHELFIDEEHKFTAKGNPVAHGLAGCPVVRFTCGEPDDEGRALGVINDTMVALQNRVNQSAFSTNITADFGAFKVRTAAGLQVLYKVGADGEPLLDAEGNPIPEPITVSQSKMLVSEAPDTKFGQLDETPLDGYLKAEDQATKNLAAIAQFPLHALIGNVSNLSAEALNALEQQFMRHMKSLHTSWGESHEELFRLMAEALGDSEGSNAFGGEVRWRDMESKAFGATLDGLGKAADMLHVPKRGLWAMIPGMTSGDLQDLEALHELEVTDAIFNEQTPGAATQRERRPVKAGGQTANQA
jgi:hypothetical protein